MSLDSCHGHGLTSAWGPRSATLVPMWAYSPRDAQQSNYYDNMDDPIEIPDTYGKELGVCTVSNKLMSP